MSKPTKTHCMVVHAYYPLGETRVEREAQALVNDGYAVDVICLKRGEHPSTEEVGGVSVFRLPVSRHKKSGRLIQFIEYLVFFFLSSIKLLALYSKKHYDCVQVHNLPDFLVFAAALPKLFGAKVILDIHDMMPDFYAASINREMDSLPVRLVVLEERLSCRFADRIICVTENARQALIDRGVPKEKISIVMNVADSEIFNRSGEKNKILDDNQEFRLVYHGSFTKRYGVDLIVHAVNLLRDKIPGIHLTLIGGGELRDDLIGLTEQYNLEGNVHFSENLVISTDLPELLRNCDVGIVPNQNDPFTDGLLPTKLLEYTALGLPVIAAKTSTISNYFDETMLMFFEPGNVTDLSAKIYELYRNPQMRLELIHNSNRFNEQYRWDEIAADYTHMVDGLIRQ